MQPTESRAGRQVSLTLPDDIREPVAALAARERVSRNTLIVRLLDAALAADAKARSRAAKTADPQ